MDIQRLTQLRDHIAALPPSEFNMQHFGTADGETSLWDEPARALRNCGTAGCIAGYACFLFAPETPFSDAGATAQDLLGLTYDQRRLLFTPATAPQERWEDITPAQAAATLTRLIETGRVTW